MFLSKADFDDLGPERSTPLYSPEKPANSRPLPHHSEMALPGFDEPSGYEPTNRHKLEQESFAPKHSSDQPPSTPDSASGESNLAARRQKMMEQQRLQLQLKKKNSLNSGILRLDSGSPMRPSSASNSPNNFRSLDPNSPSSASGVPLTYGGTSSRPASPQTGLFGSLRPASPGLSSAAGYSLDNQQQPTGNNSNPNGTSAFSYAPPSLESYSSTDYTQKDAATTNSTASPNVSALEKEMMAQGIQPIFEPNVAPPKLEAKIDLTDLRSFLNTPPARDVVIQCHIVRQKSGLMNKLYPTYELYTKDDQFLMASKKRTKNKTSNYLISTDRNDMEKTSSSFVGKVRSNFVGTEFVFYDKGLSPKEFADKVLNNVSILTVRQELGYVQYESNVLGSRGPRKMTVGIPRVNRDGTRETFRPIKEEDSIVARAKRMESDNMMTLHNKFPRWNDQFEAYVLNFNGRVTMASVKNFQLIFDEDPENVILQFGRVAKDKFTMDFKWPLTPLQAFSICLSSFDYKLACE